MDYFPIFVALYRAHIFCVICAVFLNGHILKWRYLLSVIDWYVARSVEVGEFIIWSSGLSTFCNLENICGKVFLWIGRFSCKVVNLCVFILRDAQNREINGHC